MQSEKQGDKTIQDNFKDLIHKTDFSNHHNCYLQTKKKNLHKLAKFTEPISIS